MAASSTQKPAIGIDLGTTYCYVGVCHRGNVDVIANAQGNRATPAYVSYTAKETIVGEAAYNNQTTAQSANTISHAKALLGQKWSSPEVQALISSGNFPFNVHEGENDSIAIDVELNEEVKTLSVEDVVSELLKQMRLTASNHFGSDVFDAVISVPSAFSEEQRQALHQAATKANLNVLGLVSEPAAVALAYGLDIPQANQVTSGMHQVYVIIDVAGSSTKVSVLGVRNGIIELLGSAVDAQLCGDVIDERLLKHFSLEFSKQNDGLDLSSSSRARTRLLHACEKAKQALSASTRTSIELDALYEGVDFFTDLTRAKYESMCSDLFRRLPPLIDRALAAAHVEKDEVISYALNGGGAKIPRVISSVRSFFGGSGRRSAKALPNPATQSPDEMIAYGCALQAGLLANQDLEHSHSEMDELEVKLSTLSIGVENAAGELFVLLPRNTPLPTLVSIHTSLESVGQGGRVTLYEGEKTAKARENHVLATLELPPPSAANGSGNKSGAAAAANINDYLLELSMDSEGNLDLQLTHTLSRTRHAISIPADASKRLSAEAIQSALDAGHAEHERLMAENSMLQTLVEELESRGYEMKDLVDDAYDSNHITDAERRVISKAVDDVSAWLDSIVIGPIVHARKDEIERKSKGLEILFAPVQKKIDEAKNPAAAAAPSPSPSPPMMEMGDDLD